MTTATHYENANFLRELAESLPRINPKTHKPEQVQLLQRLADEELEQARYDEWVRESGRSPRRHAPRHDNGSGTPASQCPFRGVTPCALKSIGDPVPSRTCASCSST